MEVKEGVMEQKSTEEGREVSLATSAAMGLVRCVTGANCAVSGWTICLRTASRSSSPQKNAKFPTAALYLVRKIATSFAFFEYKSEAMITLLRIRDTKNEDEEVTLREVAEHVGEDGRRERSNVPERPATQHEHCHVLHIVIRIRAPE